MRTNYFASPRTIQSFDCRKLIVFTGDVIIPAAKLKEAGVDVEIA
ncbi:MAG TPA: hypothetical protein VGO58_11675 [Chitinophagaceae bacterium]|jgi:hypothetical protein|nr:hypothetical protein [Chitinophagaceae bacterium]